MKFYVFFHSADDYFKEVYENVDQMKSVAGIAGLLNDEQFNLVPEGINRLKRRKEYNQNPDQSSLKDKREKRDEVVTP
jgi:lysine 2,3-aminomutase